MGLTAKIKQFVTLKSEFGPIASIFRFFNGRTTFFAIVFSIVGCYGWLVKARDLTSFALFAGAIQALLTVKSGLQDYHDRQTQNQATTVVNNVTVDTPSATPNVIS
jgi:hypothetical protein